MTVSQLVAKVDELGTRLREIESVIGVNSLLKQEPLLEQIKRIRERRGLVRSKTINDLVCQEFGHCLMYRRTNEPLSVIPRQVAMYLLRKHTKLSLPAIGRTFGGMHHTTVLYSCQKVEDKMSVDPIFAETVRQIEKQIEDAL